MSGSPGNAPAAGSGFVPIGNATTQFTTSFTGQGHTINGLLIYRPKADRVGLFGSVGDSGRVTDFVLVGGSIGGSSYVGDLAGIDYGVITRSSATRAISGSREVGGLVGYESRRARVSWSYATGAVSGATNIGGLVDYQHSGRLSYTYATGPVSGTTLVGGLVGYQDADGAVTTSYWDTQATGRSAGLGGSNADSSFAAAGRTTAQLQDDQNYATNYAGWDFATIWVPPVSAADNGGNGRYPRLRP